MFKSKLTEQKAKEVALYYAEKYDERCNNCNAETFEEFKKFTEKARLKLNEADRQYRMLKSVEPEPLPSYGDRMPLSVFIESVKAGAFIDYDGYGEYIQDNQLTGIEIHPSDIEHKCVRTEFTEITWFNR